MTHHSKETLDRYFVKRGGYKSMLEREDNWSEELLCTKIADYIKDTYPSAPFFFDMSGYHLSKQAASKAKNQRADGFRIPDLIILSRSPDYGMLALEVKKKGTKLFKKDGNFVADAHLNEQRVSILRLRSYGQCADFGVGYEDCIKKINDYLSKGEIKYTL
jgi:hypothetical protein